VNREIQPIIAEYIKRVILPNSRITIKIAAIEYRSKFSVNQRGTTIGLELGGDIAAQLDLDEYYVYDKNPKKTIHFFAEVLFKHLSTELPDGFLESKLSIIEPDDIMIKLFSQEKTFVELVRASEGVIRDFINIFTMAYFDANQRSMQKIDVQAITKSALQWFERDKGAELPEILQSALKDIVEEVIGNKRSRTFLVARDESQHPVIQQLFDLRILHLIAKGYSDKSHAGVRYNVFTLDYGTYVDLLKTKLAPETEMVNIEETEATTDQIVPFDDKRSIRRVILRTDIFDK